MKKPDRKNFYESKIVSVGHGIGHKIKSSRVFKKLAFEKAKTKYIDYLESQLEKEREEAYKIANHIIDNKHTLTDRSLLKMCYDLTQNK